MKNAFTILLSMVLLFSMAGCQSPAAKTGNAPLIMQLSEFHASSKDINVQAERFVDQTKENGACTLVVTWHNSGDYDALYGTSYFIERLEGEEWVSCAMRDDMTFIAIAYELPAGERRTETYNLTNLYEVSTPGTYRFRSECYVQSASCEMTKCEVVSKFSLIAIDMLDLENADRERELGSLDSFSFCLTWNVLGISSYDSTTGKLVKSCHATNPDDYITTCYLSEFQKREIYNLIAGLDILSYPDSYDPHNDMLASKPSMTLILSVKTDTLEKTITAANIAYGYEANNSKGQTFLSVCKKIRDILIQTEEWQALPDYEFYYD